MTHLPQLHLRGRLLRTCTLEAALQCGVHMGLVLNLLLELGAPSIRLEKAPPRLRYEVLTLRDPVLSCTDLLSGLAQLSPALIEILLQLAVCFPKRRKGHSTIGKLCLQGLQLPEPTQGDVQLLLHNRVTAAVCAQAQYSRFFELNLKVVVLSLQLLVMRLQVPELYLQLRATSLEGRFMLGGHARRCVFSSARTEGLSATTAKAARVTAGLIPEVRCRCPCHCLLTTRRLLPQSRPCLLERMATATATRALSEAAAAEVHRYRRCRCFSSTEIPEAEIVVTWSPSIGAVPPILSTAWTLLCFANLFPVATASPTTASLALHRVAPLRGRRHRSRR
mmetsp:Transcript_29906/g.63650  ORF Transcript_29906/g.63650 Transcript_29906/m.63650 type:complete len:336 (+) Transcript_29906:1009-2016(+)